MLSWSPRPILKKSAKYTGIIGLTGYTLFKIVSSKLGEYIDAYQNELTANELYNDDRSLS